MPQNPFNKTLDWTVQKKYDRVTDDGRVFKGWVDRVHHDRGSVVMHDVTTGDSEQLGSVFVRLPGTIEVIKPRRRIEWRSLDELSPPPTTGPLPPHRSPPDRGRWSDMTRHERATLRRRAD